MSLKMNGKLLRLVGVVVIVLGIMAGLYFSGIVNYGISFIQFSMASPEAKGRWAAFSSVHVIPLLFWTFIGIVIGLVLMGFGRFLETQDK